MKKLSVFFVLSIFGMLLAACVTFAGEKAGAVIDTSTAPKGFVSVQYTNPLTKAIKVQISLGETVYTYDILDNKSTKFPLQMGAGEYKILVFQNVSGASYAQLYGETVKVDAISEKDLFTNSIQIIDFEGSPVSMKELQKISENAKTDVEKINSIYNYIVKTIRYDYDKINTLTSTYIPNNDNTYSVKAGICYDYSSLFASALRLSGIPAKLNKGYSTDIDGYHAWNQVFLDGKWVFVDTTYDASADSYKMTYKMVKESEIFKIMWSY